MELSIILEDGDICPECLEKPLKKTSPQPHKEWVLFCPGCHLRIFGNPKITVQTNPSSGHLFYKQTPKMEEVEASTVMILMRALNAMMKEFLLEN